MKKHPIKLILFLILLVITVPIIIFIVDESYSTYWTDSENQPYQDNAIKQISAIKQVKKVVQVTPLKPIYSVDGFDWSLPDNTEIEVNSGLIDGYDNDIDYINNVLSLIKWDETNPKKGEYDFSKFEERLENIAPRRTLVRLEVYSKCEAPAWALENIRSSDDNSLIFWDKSYLKHLTPYVNEFAKRYANDPRIIGVQLGIGDGQFSGNCKSGSKDGWGEFWMTPTAIAIAQNKFGFTPDIFEQQTKAIIDMYINAFGENRGKLAFTNIGPNFSWEDIGDPYNKKLRLIAEYSMKAKLGNRDGDIEKWMRFIDKAYGVDLISLDDGSCAIDFDEAYADEIRGRYWGSENEFFGEEEYILEEYGPYENQPYRFLLSSLRALQMRRNYFTVAGDSMTRIDHPAYKTQHFLRYLNKVLGKQMENTPDVFILLGEHYVEHDRVTSFAAARCVKRAEKNIPIRSFGRWLKESSRSTPAIRISMPKSEKYWGQHYYMPDDVEHEYFGRKAKQFEFDINDRLAELRCNNGCDAEVKITFKDTVKTDLLLWYDDKNRNSYQRFKTKGDNKIKTITFTVNSRFQNKLKGQDFMVNSPTDELSLIMIRVNIL